MDSKSKQFSNVLTHNKKQNTDARFFNEKSHYQLPLKEINIQQPSNKLLETASSFKMNPNTSTTLPSEREDHQQIEARLLTAANDGTCSSPVRELPCTPKPLDYRSESKRRAANDVESVLKPHSSRAVHSKAKVIALKIPSNSRVASSNSDINSDRHQFDGTSFVNEDQPSSSNSTSDCDNHPLNFLDSINQNQHLDGPSGSQFHSWSHSMAGGLNYRASSSEASNINSGHQNHSSYSSKYEATPPFYQNQHQNSNKKWCQEQKNSINSYMNTSNWSNDFTHDDARSYWRYGSYFSPLNTHENISRPTENIVNHYYNNNRFNNRGFFQGGPSHRSNRSSGRLGRNNNYRDSLPPSKHDNYKFDDHGQYNVSYHSRGCRTPTRGIKKYNRINVHSGRSVKSSQLGGKNLISVGKKTKPKKLSKDLKRPHSAGAVLMQSIELTTHFNRMNVKNSPERKEIPEEPHRKALAAAAQSLREHKASNENDELSNNYSARRSIEDAHVYMETQENAQDLSIPKFKSKLFRYSYEHYNPLVNDNPINNLKKSLGTNPSVSCYGNQTESKTDGKVDDFRPANSSVNAINHKNKFIYPSSDLTSSAPCQRTNNIVPIESEVEFEDPNHEVETIRRRRHCSESAGAALMVGSADPGGSRVPRSRSSSMGGIDTCSNNCPSQQSASLIKVTSSFSQQLRSHSALQPRLDKLLVKQLLGMDKKSLQVN